MTQRSEDLGKRSGEPTTLAHAVNGRVVGPDDDGYDDERTGFQLCGPHRPATILRAETTADVGTAVRYARERSLPLAVQCSGHGLGAELDGGVLVSTRAMTAVRVDPAARTATVAAGATWRDVIAAATPHGLAPLSGSFPEVGAVSYTLGGGVGLLARRFGFAADHVRRAEVVTADGVVRTASPTENPDLFWAIRGGGGNFGVVTELEIDLVPVTHLYGGGLFFDLDHDPGVLAGWLRWTETVPEELTSAVTLLPFPDFPGVPESLRGKRIAQLQLAFAGTEAEGREFVDPLRNLGDTVRDTVRELPYAESGSVFDEPDQPHAYRSSNLLLESPAPAAVAEIEGHVSVGAPDMCVLGVRHLGGALARPPQEGNAVGHRQAGYSVMVLSPVAEGREAAVLDKHREILAPFEGRAVGRSLNFSYGPLAAGRVREAFEPADYRRLTELKDRYDPGGLLHVNHPIPGATAHG